MSDELSLFHAIQNRLNQGDDEAFCEIFEQFSSRLIRIATNNIQPELLKRFDGEDVVQSVFRTFYRRHGEGRLRIDHSRELWQLLVSLTLFKTRSKARQHTAKKRNVKFETSFTDQMQWFGSQPTAHDALALWEEIDAVLNGLPDRAGEILSMRLEGHSKVEIAQELDLSRQTIHRVLSLVEQRLTQRFQD